VHFQFEPIAAALGYEQRATGEQFVLLSDIGGGTSDFSLVRVGPERRKHILRWDDTGEPLCPKAGAVVESGRG